MKTYFAFVLAFTVATSTLAEVVLYCAGTVLYPSGEPAAGVMVAYYPASYPGAGDYTEVKTDANGHYAIVKQETNTVFVWGGWITATNNILARDIEKNLVAIRPFARMTTNIDMILQPAITLSGSVKNTQGQPVSGAELEISIKCRDALAGSNPELSPTWKFFTLMLDAIKTDKTGSFAVAALPPGHAYSVIVKKAEGYGADANEIKEEQTYTNKFVFPPIVLKRADHKVAGCVLDSDGKPVEGVEVSIGGLGQPLGLTTKTGSGGKFHFDAVCDGEVRLHAVLWGPPPVQNDSAGTIVQGGDMNVVIRLNPNK